MSRIQEIKDAQLAARKARDGVRATLLTTLIGEAEMVGKSDGNRESTDAEVLSIVKKFEKNLNENIKLYTGDNGRLIALTYAKHELEILKEFLPQKVSDEQVRSDIEFGISVENLPRELKSLGAINKALRQAYGEQFDGQQISRIFKSMIA